MRTQILIDDNTIQRATNKINSREWWRTWVNKEALTERGLFLVSSFREAEFFGRPLDNPFKVTLKNPLIGDEPSIMRVLDLTVPNEDISIKDMYALEAKKMRAAIKLGYDSIAITSPNQFKQLKENGLLPKGYELQVFFTSSYQQLMRHPNGYGA